MRTLTGALALATALVLGSTTAQAQTKVAFVDGQRIFGSVPGRAEAEQQFNKEMDDVRAQEKAMGDSISGLISDFSKAEPTLSQADKTTRTQTIRDKQAAFQQRQQQLEQHAQQRQSELVQPILDRIHKVIEQVRAEGQYTMVMDFSPNAGGAVVAYDRNLDVTDQVISRLRAMPVASGTTTPATPAPATTTPRGAPPSPSGVTRPKSPPGN